MTSGLSSAAIDTVDSAAGVYPGRPDLVVRYGWPTTSCGPASFPGDLPPVRCPSCGERDTRVVDSRDLDDAATIRRRRECAACVTRFTTYERVESARLLVVKRSGAREEFDRSKLASGLEKALTRRPVPAGAAEAAAEAIEGELRSQGINEVGSAIVGQMAMERLRAIDQIAYIRFASVYQSFDDLAQLKREVDSLYSARTDAVPGQTSLQLVETDRAPGGVPARRLVKR
jgi:transcriptional repressor NrdR